jgi:hypothetical protein
MIHAVGAPHAITRIMAWVLSCHSSPSARDTAPEAGQVFLQSEEEEEAAESAEDAGICNS